MLYWLIPYLVAYNASDSGEWKYGPEHVFKAEVYNNVTVPMEKAHAFSEVFMDFICRPMNLSVIQCRVDSATLLKYEVVDGSNSRRESNFYGEFGLDNIVFQLQFNEEGISRVWFLNNNRSFSINMIRAIIGPLSTGVSLIGKNWTEYISLEKSINGVCDTIFNFAKMRLTKEEEKKETIIEGYKLDVPSLPEQFDDETILIEKDRNMFKCQKKTPYFFGSTEEEDAKAGYKTEKLINYSHSGIYLGRKSFSAYTENLGTIMENDFPKKSMKTEMKAGEKIRVSLQSIRPAKEELRNVENLMKVGAGFQPGTPWPERNTE